MSPSAIVLLVLVTRGEDRVETAAMSAAVRDAVLFDAQVDVREVDARHELPRDDDAIALAQASHANAVVELVWKDAAHKNLTLHFHAEGSPRFTDRQIAFEPSDGDAERGRTIGFALVSMLPESLTRPPPPLPKPPEPPPEPPPPEAPKKKEEERRPEDFVPERHAGALDLAGSMRAGADATGFGATLGGRWDFAARFSLRAAAAVHAGKLDAADATSLFLTVGGGAVAKPLLASRARPLEVAIRADLLVQRMELDHTQSTGGTVSGARWSPAADLVVDGMWLFAGNLGLFAAAGAEAAFGETTVFVAGQPVATVAPLRLVAEAGVRVLF
ncbi:MAG TPA: hypothetical protein VIF62_20265 [Labilithrix sp.]|jgi:hypothetical protein